MAAKRMCIATTHLETGCFTCLEDSSPSASHTFSGKKGSPFSFAKCMRDVDCGLCDTASAELVVAPVEIREPALNGLVVTFLLKLGKTLLQEKEREWLDIDRICEFAKEHDIQLGGRQLNPGELEALLRDFFRDREDWAAEDVELVAYERRLGWDLLFMLRAYPYTPRHLSISEMSLGDENKSGFIMHTLPLA